MKFPFFKRNKKEITITYPHLKYETEEEYQSICNEINTPKTMHIIDYEYKIANEDGRWVIMLVYMLLNNHTAYHYYGDERTKEPLSKYADRIADDVKNAVKISGSCILDVLPEDYKKEVINQYPDIGLRALLCDVKMAFNALRDGKIDEETLKQDLLELKNKLQDIENLSTDDIMKFNEAITNNSERVKKEHKEKIEESRKQQVAEEKRNANLDKLEDAINDLNLGGDE